MCETTQAQTIFRDDFEGVQPVVEVLDPDDGQCTHTISTPSRIEILTTWRNTPRYCDYLVKAPTSPLNAQVLQVAATLSIEPGVVVRFERAVSIKMIESGGLQAIGTPTRRIKFEAAERTAGFAEGLHFGHGSLTSTLDYVDFINLGRKTPVPGDPDAAIDGTQGAGGVRITNTAVRGAENSAMDLVRLPVLAFENNRFSGNGGHPLEIGAHQVHRLDVASDYLGGAQPNGLPSIYVYGVNYPLERETVDWHALNVPYYVRVAVWIEDGARLNVKPGVTFRMDEGASINVKKDSSLHAVGTSDKPIRFIRHQQNKPWDGIRWSSTRVAANRLDHVVVDGAGADANLFPGNLNIDYRSGISVFNTTISNSQNYGVCVDRIGSEQSKLFSDGSITFINNPSGNLAFCD